MTESTATDATPLARSERGPDELGLMRRTCIAMFTIGGLICFIGVWVTQSTTESRIAQSIIAAALLLAGLVLWLVREPHQRLMEASVVWSLLLLGVLMAVSNPLGMGPVFYLWPVVLVAYFCSRQMLAGIFTLMMVTLAIGLIANSTHDLKLDTFIGTFATVGVMAALVSAMTDREARLRHELGVAAETDPLTGLLNRRAFNPRLELLVAGAVRQERPLSVVMFDLDHFKALNDEHGHLAGDRALQEVAEILRSASRDQDLVSRFGGEEFAVALPGAESADALVYTARVAAALRTSTELTLSTSAGICSLGPEEAAAETLLLRADHALYAAKEAGRCRPAVWGPDEIEVGPRFGEPTRV